MRQEITQVVNMRKEEKRKKAKEEKARAKEEKARAKEEKATLKGTRRKGRPWKH